MRIRTNEPNNADHQSALEQLGLFSVGRFDCQTTDHVDAASVEIVANAGSVMFDHVRHSPEYADGNPDPMNRWTRRVLDEHGRRFGFAVAYPFDGPPWMPFQRWAKRASVKLHQSPIGLLIHEELGLWIALRGAFLHAEPAGAEGSIPATTRPSPCEDCADKPCLSACPVGAFSAEGYDVLSCANHLASEDRKSCVGLGCAARHACPIGQANAYNADHARFHMEAFVRSNSIKSE